MDMRIKIYRTVILPVVLYGCQTWSLNSWEERRLRVFDKLLRTKFRPKQEKVRSVRRKLNNEVLN